MDVNELKERMEKVAEGLSQITNNSVFVELEAYCQAPALGRKHSLFRLVVMGYGYREHKFDTLEELEECARRKTLLLKKFTR